MAVWWDLRPKGASGGGVAVGLALFVPDGGRAGQADGVAPGTEQFSTTLSCSSEQK